MCYSWNQFMLTRFQLDKQFLYIYIIFAWEQSKIQKRVKPQEFDKRNQTKKLLQAT